MATLSQLGVTLHLTEDEISRLMKFTRANNMSIGEFASMQVRAGLPKEDSNEMEIQT